MTPEEKQAAHAAIDAHAQGDELVSRARAMLYRAAAYYDQADARGMATAVSLLADSTKNLEERWNG